VLNYKTAGEFIKDTSLFGVTDSYVVTSLFFFLSFSDQIIKFGLISLVWELLRYSTFKVFN
jgi:hypothetical protein